MATVDYSFIEHLLHKHDIPFSIPTPGHYRLHLREATALIYYPKARKVAIHRLGKKEELIFLASGEAPKDYEADVLSLKQLIRSTEEELALTINSEKPVNLRPDRTKVDAAIYNLQLQRIAAELDKTAKTISELKIALLALKWNS